MLFCLFCLDLASISLLSVHACTLCSEDRFQILSYSQATCFFEWASILDKIKYINSNFQVHFALKFLYWNLSILKSPLKSRKWLNQKIFSYFVGIWSESLRKIITRLPTLKLFIYMRPLRFWCLSVDLSIWIIAWVRVKWPI